MARFGVKAFLQLGHIVIKPASDVVTIRLVARLFSSVCNLRYHLMGYTYGEGNNTIVMYMLNYTAGSKKHGICYHYTKEINETTHNFTNAYRYELNNKGNCIYYVYDDKEGGFRCNINSKKPVTLITEYGSKSFTKLHIHAMLGELSWEDEVNSYYYDLSIAYVIVENVKFRTFHKVQSRLIHLLFGKYKNDNPIAKSDLRFIKRY
jgi:hypothetical protein